MNKTLIDQLTAQAAELRARPDANYHDRTAATALLNAVEHLGLADAQRAKAAKEAAPTAAPAPDAPTN